MCFVVRTLVNGEPGWHKCAAPEIRNNHRQHTRLICRRCYWLREHAALAFICVFLFQDTVDVGKFCDGGQSVCLHESSPGRAICWMEGVSYEGAWGLIVSYRSGCLVNHSSLLELQVFLHGNSFSQQLPKRGGGGEDPVKLWCLFCVEIDYWNWSTEIHIKILKIQVFVHPKFTTFLHLQVWSPYLSSDVHSFNSTCMHLITRYVELIHHPSPPQPLSQPPPPYPYRYALSLIVALGGACSCFGPSNCISHFTFQIPTPCRIPNSWVSLFPDQFFLSWSSSFNILCAVSGFGD